MGKSAERLAVGRRYVQAAAMAVAVTVGRLRLDPWLGHSHNRHLVFLPAVMLIAWLWGFGPGLFGSALFGGGLLIFWQEPPGSFLHTKSDVALFLLVSGVMCATIRSLQRARQRADASTRSREQVLAVVAHDLTNPLYAVKLAEERLRPAARDNLSTERGLKTIRNATVRMEHLLRDLVDTTRIEHGELAVALRPESVASVVQEVAQLYGPQAVEARLMMETTVPPEDCVVDCDRDRLLQILGNLMGNALKFTPEGGRIALRAAAWDEAVHFEVEDTGSGIQPEHLPRIFDRFETFDSRGTGLGLFIARSLVAAHGGTLTVQTALGQGTTFSFELPRRGS
jgi:signal transduction histidine kinase